MVHISYLTHVGNCRAALWRASDLIRKSFILRASMHLAEMIKLFYLAKEFGNFGQVFYGNEKFPLHFFRWKRLTANWVVTFCPKYAKFLCLWKAFLRISFNSCNVFQLGWVGGISLWKLLTGKERHFSGCDVDLSTFIRRSFNLRQRSAPSEFDNWSVLLPFVTFVTHCPVKYNLFTFTFHSTEKVGIFFRLQSLLLDTCLKLNY